MIKNNKGFTIVEITITVFIIAILAGITIVAFTKVQTDARDSARSSKINIIAEALEKYYERNGEYPGCAAMTQAGNLVSTNVLKGIDTDVLRAPKSAPSTTNSFTCTSLTAGPGDDVYAYVGNSNATCSTGAACLYYTLQYRQEGTGAIISLESRRKITGVVPAGPVLNAPTVPAAPAGYTTINLSWATVPNTANYVLQRATNSGFTTGLVEGTVPGANTTHASTGLTQGITYYYRLAAEGSGGRGAWSNTVSAATLIAPPPAAPTVTLNQTIPKTSATSVTATASVVTCAAGTTAQYRLQSLAMNTSPVPSFPAWGGTWSTTRTLAVNMSQGYRYDFRAQARCTSGASSAVTGNSSTVSITRYINTPPAPVYLSPPYFYSNVNAVVNYSYTCPTGTSLNNGHYDTRAWTGAYWYGMEFGFNDSWENYDGVNRNTEYWGYYRCSTPYDTSAESPASYNVIVVRP